MNENILAVFNRENVSEEESKYYKQRRSVRTVAFDHCGRIACMNIQTIFASNDTEIRLS